MPLFFLWLAPIFGGGIFMPLEESVENFHPIDINIFSSNIQNKNLNKQKLALYCNKSGDYLEPKTNDKLIEQGYHVIQIDEFNYPYY